MPLKLIAGPAVEPITLAEAKEQCRVEHDDEDGLIQALIAAAREQAEHLTGRPFIAQTWELVLDAFPSAEIALEKANVLGIESVKYLDVDGVEQTMSSSAYSLDAESAADCWLLPAQGVTWPSTVDTANAVRLRFTCGYGPAASDVPSVVKIWMKLTVGHYFRNREAVGTDKLAEMPGVSYILDSVRIWRF